MKTAANLRIGLWLGQYRWYARASSALKAFRFRVRRREYWLSEAIRTERLESASFRSLMGLAIPSILISASALAAFAWLDRAGATIGWRPIPDSFAEVYADTMLGVAGMGGVFIGLYYAAISAVATRSYGDVPSEIRFLLAKDRAGRTYMRLLVFVTCFALLSLVLHIGFSYTSKTAVIAALLLGAAAVVSFVQLGNRAFHLLDPSVFTREVLYNFEYYVIRVGRTTLRSADPEFQQHSRALAESAFSTLEAIFSQASDAGPGRVRMTPDICSELHSALLRYIGRKPSIPIESRWYPQVFVQRRWFTTSDTITTVAAQTSTALHPDTRTDWYWVEQRFDEIVESVVRSLLGAVHIDQLLTCVARFAGVLQRRAAVGDVSGSVNAWRNLSRDVSAALVTNADHYVDKITPMAVVDALASIPVSVAIGFREYLEKWQPEHLAKHVKVIAKLAGRQFPFGSYPFHLIERLSWIVVRNDYERLADGRQVAPTWYHEELVRHAEANHIDLALRSILDQCSDHYESLASNLRGTHKGIFEAAALVRELEFVAKTRICIQHETERMQALMSSQRIDGLRWPKPQNLEEVLAKRESALMDRMIPLLVVLIALPDDESIPDYAGRFVAAIADATFLAVVHGSLERLAKLFPALVYGSMKISEKMKTGTEPGPAPALTPQQHASVAVVAQFLDIAGYARVFADLHDKPAIWNTVKAALDIYFKTDPEQSTYLKAILRLSAWGGLGGIPHMSSYRLSRRGELSRHLQPLRKERSDRYRDVALIDHPSALVRAMDGPMGMGPEGLDVFALVYMHDELGVPLKELGYRVADMDRNRKRREGG